jgi:hypothetical protein
MCGSASGQGLRGACLRELVVVMREAEVHAPGVDVDCVADQRAAPHARIAISAYFEPLCAMHNAVCNWPQSVLLGIKCSALIHPHLAMAEHSMCHPGRPGPQGESQNGSPARAAFQRAKSHADCGIQARV